MCGVTVRGQCGADSTGSFGSFYLISGVFCGPRLQLPFTGRCKRAHLLWLPLHMNSFCMCPWFSSVQSDFINFHQNFTQRFLSIYSNSSSSFHYIYFLWAAKEDLLIVGQQLRDCFYICFAEVNCFTVFLICQRECTQTQIHPHYSLNY